MGVEGDVALPPPTPPAPATRSANKSFQDSDRAGPSGRARPTQEHTPEARPGQEPSMQAQYSPSTQRAPQEAQGIINWGSYSIYLEPHKLRWILRCVWPDAGVARRTVPLRETVAASRLSP